MISLRNGDRCEWPLPLPLLLSPSITVDHAPLTLGQNFKISIFIESLFRYIIAERLFHEL